MLETSARTRPNRSAITPKTTLPMDHPTMNIARIMAPCHPIDVASEVESNSDNAGKSTMK
ncbi:MAG: hypothetical protein R3D26_18945 [Cyanobacteriota/Melainabacteria group bacterium]